MDQMIGKFARSKAGHDKDRIYVITGEDAEYVYLVDGKLRKTANPKRKRKKHIQLIQRADAALSQLQSAQKPVTDEQIKAAIKHGFDGK